MNNHFVALGKLIAVPFIVLIYFVFYGQVLTWVNDVLPFTHLSPWWVVTVVSIQGLFLACATGAVLALPLAWFYGRVAPLISLLCVAPIVALSWRNPFGASSLVKVIASDVELVCLLIIVPVLAEKARSSLKAPQE